MIKKTVGQTHCYRNNPIDTSRGQRPEIYIVFDEPFHLCRNLSGYDKLEIRNSSGTRYFVADCP
eukprot:2297016-Rhodomonas_salina.1